MGQQYNGTNLLRKVHLMAGKHKCTHTHAHTRLQCVRSSRESIRPLACGGQNWGGMVAVGGRIAKKEAKKDTHKKQNDNETRTLLPRDHGETTPQLTAGADTSTDAAIGSLVGVSASTVGTLRPPCNNDGGRKRHYERVR